MLNLLLGLLISAIPLPQKPVHYVTDNASVLDAGRVAFLEKELQQFERDTSDQVIVYIDRRVPEGTTLEEMSAQAIHDWGIGQKGKNNGVILFLFLDDHKMRIEVGYGLEGALTDAKSKLITSTVIKPKLRAGDAASAVVDGVDAILSAIRGEPNKGSGRTAAEARFFGMTGSDLFGIAVFFVAIPLLALGALIAFVRTLVRGARGSASGISTGSTSSSSDSSSSFSDSGGSSDFSSSDSGSSDFSGGGGDGGGGGASDSW